MTALEILDQVPEFARCVALELNRLSDPKKDEITTNEAYRRYGRSWVEKYTSLGHLHPFYRGKKKLYSQSELVRIEAKENAAARLAIK